MYMYMYRVMFSYLQMYVEYIRSLPINNTPEIFGLHDNANITFAQNDTNAMLEALLLLQPKSSSAGGSSREEVSVNTVLAHCYSTQSGFYLGIFVWEEAISPQVTKLFLAKIHKSTQGGRLKFWEGS